MIASLRGILAESREDVMILEVGGWGIEVQVHGRTLRGLPVPGSPVTVFTYLQVAENDLKLYGFLQREELDLFKLLIGISGMGARGALNILAALAPAEFLRAIASGDEKRLLAVSGIGKKTAQRLLFELKDKVGTRHGIPVTSAGDAGRFEEMLEALEALGYQRSEVFPLMVEMDSQGALSERVEDGIKQVLRRKAALMKK